MANKKYYWLKLMKDFFVQARIKKLRRIAGGDTYVIIYLKLMLLGINTNGVITFENIENTIEEELALILDEEVDNIKVLLAYLMANNLCNQISKNEYDLSEVKDLIGSEAASTQRSRKSREKKKVLHCNINATQLQQLATKSNTEKEIEKEIDILDDDEAKKEIITNINNLSAFEYQSKLQDFIHYVYKHSIQNFDGLYFTIDEKIKSMDLKTLVSFNKFITSNEIKQLKKVRES